MANDNRGTSSLFRRAEQLRRWQESETNKQDINNIKLPKKRKVKFSDGCIFLAAGAAGDKDELKRLLDRGADVNTVNQDGITALHAACIDNNLEIVEFLVDNNADINQCDMEGWTPLHATASCGSLSMAEFLISRGADLSLVNNDGELAIDVADEDEMANLLQEEMDKRGIDSDASRMREEKSMLQDARTWLSSGKCLDMPHPKTGATAFHVAAAKGYVKVMRLLLDLGVDIDAKDYDGWTPLHAAAHWGQAEAVEILSEAMVDMESVNNVGQTAYDLADDAIKPLMDELARKQASARLISQPRTNAKKRKSSPPRKDKHSKIEKETPTSKKDLDGVSDGGEVVANELVKPSENAGNATSSSSIDLSEVQSWRRPSLRNKSQPEEKPTSGNEIRSIQPKKSVSNHTEQEEEVVLRRDLKEKEKRQLPRQKAFSCLALNSGSLGEPGNRQLLDEDDIPAEGVGGKEIENSANLIRSSAPSALFSRKNLSEQYICDTSTDKYRPTVSSTVPSNTSIVSDFLSNSSRTSSSTNSFCNSISVKTSREVFVTSVCNLPSPQVGCTANNTNCTFPKTTFSNAISASSSGGKRSMFFNSLLQNPGSSSSISPIHTYSSVVSSSAFVNYTQSLPLSSISSIPFHRFNSYSPTLHQRGVLGNQNLSTTRSCSEVRLYGSLSSPPPLRSYPVMSARSATNLTNTNRENEMLLRSQSLKERLQRNCQDVLRSSDTELNTSSSSTTSNSTNRLTNRTFAPPARDEESETQRKAHAKMVRSTRRSTQGITLEDIKSAEQYIKTTTKPTTTSTTTSPVVTSVPNSSLGGGVTVTVSSSTVPSITNFKTGTGNSSDTNTTASSRIINSSPSATGVSNKTSNTKDNSFSLENVVLSSNKSSERLSSTQHTNDASMTSASVNEDKKDDKNDDKASSTREGTQAVIQRRKKAKRRSTGVVHVDMDEIDPDRKTEKSDEAEGSTDEIETTYASDKEIQSSKISSQRAKSSTISSSIHNGELDYKKLYEEQLAENGKLLDRIRMHEKDLKMAKDNLEAQNRIVNATADSERREKRSLERKLSEMEEELKELEQLKIENERLKDENGALIRVISKLSR